MEALLSLSSYVVPCSRRQGAGRHQSDLHQVHNAASGPVHPHRLALIFSHTHPLYSPQTLIATTQKFSPCMTSPVLVCSHCLEGQHATVAFKAQVGWSCRLVSFWTCCTSLFFRGVGVGHQTHRPCSWSQSRQPRQEEHAVFCKHILLQPFHHVHRLYVTLTPKFHQMRVLYELSVASYVCASLAAAAAFLLRSRSFMKFVRKASANTRYQSTARRCDKKHTVWHRSCM